MATKVIKEIVTDVGGNTTIEYSDDTTQKYNVADVVTAQTNPLTGGIELSPQAEARLVVDRLVSRSVITHKSARIRAMSNLVLDLINAGVWGKLDAFYVFASGSEQFAKLNWRMASAQDATNINGCVFSTDQGIAGDGSTSYLSTGLAGNAADFYSQDSAFVAVWSLTELSNNTANDASIAGKTYLNCRAVAGSASARCNNSSASVTSAPVASALGMLAVSRQSSSGFTLYKNETVLTEAAVASETLSSTAFEVGRNSVNYSPRKIAIAAVGGGLSQSEYFAFYAACKIYLQAAGAI